MTLYEEEDTGVKTAESKKWLKSHSSVVSLLVENFVCLFLSLKESQETSLCFSLWEKASEKKTCLSYVRRRVTPKKLLFLVYSVAESLVPEGFFNYHPSWWWWWWWWWWWYPWWYSEDVFLTDPLSPTSLSGCGDFSSHFFELETLKLLGAHFSSNEGPHREWSEYVCSARKVVTS